MIDADPLVTTPLVTTLPEHAAFDAVADGYDLTFTQPLLGQWLRKAVQRQLAERVQPDDHVLELGCGTGEDALWLAQRGARVTATDASSAMLEIAARKAAAAGLADRISFAQLDLSHAPAWQQPEQNHYDKVLANFGVLNCLPDHRALAATLAQWLRPGGLVALVLMSPFCPWEIAWHLAHGRIRSAFRRFRSGSEAHIGNGSTVRVWYPSPRQLCAEFAPNFRPIHAAGIGILLPPAYLASLVTRWPRLFAHLAGWERHLEHHFPWTWCADHYLIILQRQPIMAEAGGAPAGQM
jgi:ubiquinone/menaquinone biosynthesis C-methylase UbiE